MGKGQGASGGGVKVLQVTPEQMRAAVARAEANIASWPIWKDRKAAAGQEEDSRRGAKAQREEKRLNLEGWKDGRMGPLARNEDTTRRAPLEGVGMDAKKMATEGVEAGREILPLTLHELGGLLVQDGEGRPLAVVFYPAEVSFMAAIAEAAPKYATVCDAQVPQLVLRRGGANEVRSDV